MTEPAKINHVSANLPICLYLFCHNLTSVYTNTINSLSLLQDFLLQFTEMILRSELKILANI